MRNPVPAIWLLANLFHPVILVTWFGGWDFTLNSEDIGIAMMVFIYAFLFSLPSLFMGFIMEYLISKTVTDRTNRYLCWLFFSPLIALLNWVLVASLFGGWLHWRELSLAIPSMIAVVLASLIRYASFLKQETTTEKNEHESEPIV